MNVEEFEEMEMASDQPLASLWLHQLEVFRLESLMSWFVFLKCCCVEFGFDWLGCLQDLLDGICLVPDNTRLAITSQSRCSQALRVDTAEGKNGEELENMRMIHKENTDIYARKENLSHLPSVNHYERQL